MSADWLELYHVAVIGNTGVGKSALCNLLSGRSSTHLSYTHKIEVIALLVPILDIALD